MTIKVKIPGILSIHENGFMGVDANLFYKGVEGNCRGIDITTSKCVNGGWNTGNNTGFDVTLSKYVSENNTGFDITGLSKFINSDNRGADITEIGRASCRERV